MDRYKEESGFILKLMADTGVVIEPMSILTFTTLTRQLTVEEPVSEPKEIYRLARFLLGRQRLVSRPLRLLGLSVSNLREPTAQQLVLFSG